MLRFSTATGTAAFLLFVLFAGSALAAETGQVARLNGIDVFYGVIPGEILTGHRADHAERKMHGGVPRGSGQHHLIGANLKGGTVSVIDTQARKEVAQIAVGKGPAQTGFTADGRLALVSLSQENAVALIDPDTRKVVARIDVGTVPIQVYATPDGKTLFVANQGTKQKPGTTVSAIDLQARKVATTLQTGAGAHGVVVDRDGRYAFISNIYANTVSVIEVRSLKVLKNVPVGRSPNGISVASP